MSWYMCMCNLVKCLLLNIGNNDVCDSKYDVILYFVPFCDGGVRDLVGLKTEVRHDGIFMTLC